MWVMHRYWCHANGDKSMAFEISVDKKHVAKIFSTSGTALVRNLVL